MKRTKKCASEPRHPYVRHVNVSDRLNPFLEKIIDIDF